jgi:putative ABC transport system permease protein
MDDSLARLYEKEQKLSFFSSVLLIVTVMLSAVGLVGLSSYVAELRTKEIGIRKVLGASVESILRLVSGPFFRISVVAFMFGSALSFYLIDLWLQTFAYRIDISWTFYAYTFAALIIVIITTVGVHALKAAVADPVKSLRSE